MKRLLPAIGAVSLSLAAGCTRLGDVLTGVGAFVDAGSLVDNVAFVPGSVGRTTPDSGGATTIDPGVTDVRITFVDALDPASVAGFSMARNLVFSGVAPDPAHPPYFNASPIGLIRANQVLDIPLATPLPVGGPFTIGLVSGIANPLRTIGSDVRFTGTYSITLTVVARDVAPPFVANVSTSVGEIGALSPEEVLSGGIIQTAIEPHSAIRIEFSEEMRPGVPVLTTPTIGVPTTFTIHGETLTFHVPTTPGLELVETTGPTALSPAGATVLATKAGVPMELDADYSITIPSATSLAIQTTIAQDLSGRPLAANVAGLASGPAMDFSFRFHTSSVSIDAPASGSYISSADLANGPITASGRVAMNAGGVVVDILRESRMGEQLVDSVAGRLTSKIPQQTVFGVNVLPWEAVVPPADFHGGDGPYRLRARVATGGTDSAHVVVDTTPPTISAVSGDFDLYASDETLGSVCVALEGSALSSDADHAELYLGHGSPFPPGNQTYELLASSQQRVMLHGSIEFCFPPVGLANRIFVGRNTLQVRAYDHAGNVAVRNMELRNHAFLLSVSPALVDPRGTPRVTLTGYGLTQFGHSPAGAPIDPVHPDVVFVDLRPSGTSVTTTPGLLFETLEFDAAADADRGPVSVRIGGLESNRLRFDVCRDPAQKYVTDLALAEVTFTNNGTTSTVSTVLPDLRIAYDLERDPLGEPVFAWTEKGRLRIQATGASPYATIGGYPDDSLGSGDPVRLLRRPDGTLIAVYVTHATNSGATNGALTAPGITAIDVGSGAVLAHAELQGKPRSLSAAFDPTLHAPVASTVSISGVVYYTALAAGAPSPALVGALPPELSTLNPSYSTAIAVDALGRTRIAASGDATLFWQKSGATWSQESAQFFGYVASMIATPDSSEFHAVLWRPGTHDPLALGNSSDPRDLGIRTIGGVLADFSTPADGSNWTVRWKRPMSLDAGAFRSPVEGADPGNAADLLARSADLSFTLDGAPRLAFLDAEHRSLDLLTQFPGYGRPERVDIEDVGAALGLVARVSVDGNGEALVASADFSNAGARPAPGDLFDNDALPRIAAAVQYVDARNHEEFSPEGGAAGARCHTTRFRRAFISQNDWNFIRNDPGVGQAADSRVVFTFPGLTLAFVPPLAETNLEKEYLFPIHANAAVLSRFLKSRFTIRAWELSPGQLVPGTIDSDPLHPMTDRVLDEPFGLHVPAGMKAATSTTIETVDTGDLHAIQIARFQPQDTAVVGGPAVRPPPLTGGVAAIASSSGNAVLFGGRKEDKTLSQETWVYEISSNRWLKISPPVEPSARVGHAMATGPTRDTIVLFGGTNAAGAVLGDTWIFNTKLQTWTQIFPATPPNPRSGAAMTFAEGQEWLFGGVDAAGADLNDLHVFDATLQWNAAGPPSLLLPARLARGGAALAFDAKNRRLLLFGGTDGTVVFNDVFTFDLATSVWVQVSPGTTLPTRPGAAQYFGRARIGPSLVFTRNGGSLLAFGGATETVGFSSLITAALVPGSTIDAFDFSTETWDVETPRVVPVPREGQAWFYDDRCEQLYVFGGDLNGQLLDDTLVYSVAGHAACNTTALGGTWRALIPGTKEAVDFASGGKGITANPGIETQWGRADFAPFLASPQTYEVLSSLAIDTFPPIVSSTYDVHTGLTLTTAVTDFTLGPIRFDEIMGLHSDGSNPGTLHNHASLGTITIDGKFDLTTSLPTTVATGPLTITTDIPTIGGVIIPGFECSALLNLGNSGGLVNPAPMTATVDLAPAVDNLGEAPGPGHQADQTVGEIKAYPRSTGTNTHVPICVKAGGNLVALAGNVLEPAIGSVTDGLVHLAGLTQVSLPAGFAPHGTGPFAGLGTVASYIIGDAYTCNAVQCGNSDYSSRRTDGFQSLADPSRPTILPLEDVDWIGIEPDGIMLMLRPRADVAAFPHFP